LDALGYLLVNMTSFDYDNWVPQEDEPSLVGGGMYGRIW